MKSKTILLLLVGLLVIFGAAAIYLGIQLSQSPSQLPQTGADPNTICDTSTANNGFLFICNATADGQLFSCKDRQYHPANYAHACAQVIKPETSCANLSNYGAGPWEGDANKLNFVGCYFGATQPQNCFCPSYPGGTAQCYTDTYGWGDTYDSCGARQNKPIDSPTPSPSVSPTSSPSITPSQTLPPGTTLPPTTKPPTTTPPATGTPTITPSGTIIPKSAIVTDEIDRISFGGLLFLVGLAFLATGKFVNLGTILTDIVNGQAVAGIQTKFKKQKTLQEREDFEEKFG